MTPRGDLPRKIGKYRVLSRLGGGGMGIVYLAQDSRRHLVALKLIRPELAEDDSFRIRFSREVSAASTVAGTCTAKVLDADVDAPQPYLVTEYVPGPTLDVHVAHLGPLAGPSLFGFALALAEAVNAVHAAGLVHRDMKPSNVILSADGPRLIDFGIARAAEATAITRTGISIGTPAWMSPEQVRGGHVGPSSDIFSWGGLVAFAASGRSPFGEGSSEALLYRIVHEPPDIPELPQGLSELVHASQSKDANSRPEAVGIVRQLLGNEGLGDSPAELTNPVTQALEQTWPHDIPDYRGRPPRRWRRGLAVALLLLALLGSGAAGAWAFITQRESGDSSKTPVIVAPTETESSELESPELSTPGQDRTRAADTATTEPSPQPPALEESSLALNGIGPIRVGMTLQQAEAAAERELRFEGYEGSTECGYAYPVGGPNGLAFMVQDGEIARVDVDAVGITTLSGIGVGSTEQDVRATYPGQIAVEEHPYSADAGWHYLVYMPQDPGDAGYSLIFETNGTRVQSFRSGFEDAVTLIEGCS